LYLGSNQGKEHDRSVLKIKLDPDKLCIVVTQPGVSIADSTGI
jgi:hypothetical protein